MRRILTRFLARRAHATGEHGVTAVMVAITMVGLLVATGMVLDFGLVRIDRQVDKSVADAATLAGLANLDPGDRKPHPYRGVCAALRYLRSNDDRFAGVTSSTGTWTDGNGSAVANGCNDSTLQGKVCTSADLTTWSKFTWAGTWQGEPLKVVIQSGYVLPGPAAASGPSPDTGWPEDSLPAAQADSDDGAQGCDQLATIVTESRKPGLGSLARATDLTTSVRSVGRVALGPGGSAPAMLLLDQHGCQVLSSTSSGSGASVHVYGDVSVDGRSTPGSIHSDSDAGNCSSSPHQNVFYGAGADAIVAYAAPLASNTSQPDPNKPGQITSVAANNGVAASTLVDNPANVYGSSALNESGASTATKTAPTGRAIVTRKVVDDRYLGLNNPGRGVKAAVANANNVFTTITSSSAAASAGYVVINTCNAGPADMSSVTSTSNVYINCTANNGYVGTTPIQGKTVVFAGAVNPGNISSGTPSVSLPNADHVYVFGAPGSDGISLGNGGTFSMHTNGNLTGSQCSSATTTSKAVLFVKAGDIKGTGGLLQLCKTTVVMMGNQGNGCLPSTAGTAPNPAPCGGAAGDGQIVLSGGAGVDWTAPNTMDVTTDAVGWPTAAAIAAWTDPDGPEDLALWDESLGQSNTPKFGMSGGGVLHTVGVFMVPNAAPFTIGGGSTQNLTNAQYVAADIWLNGGAVITMKVDANAGVRLPKLKPVGLVR